MPSRLAAALVATIAVPVTLSSTAAAVAVSAPTHRQEVAAVKYDLRGLAVAEETYFTDHIKYTTNLSQLRAEGYGGSKHTTVRVIWVQGTRSYCLAGRYRHAGPTTRRSYDSSLGGVEGEHFSCEAHRPGG